jgi:hypothetical protein
MAGCCTVPTPEAPPTCPLCGARGRLVPRRTVEALLRPERRGSMTGARYFFVEGPGCEVVYYAGDGSHWFAKEDLVVRVGSKETEPPIPVCYCFEKTEAMVIEDVLAHGRSAIFDEIMAHVRAGECHCDVKNPSGRCCLRAVTRAIQKAQRIARLGSAP